MASDIVAPTQNISQFMIFGDDKDFMQNMSTLLIEKEESSDYKIFVSDFSEELDLYLSSQLCSSFLMSAANSTFGWWLAFFARDQNNVYYLNDRILNNRDKMPSADQFL
ncbi:hypothetical protein OESDEN_09495 [Oesophagostomum dentatum]|uniref:Uncharacterized protein n=1 Tax=Oesophagostomum dentatum TaxID=61180 RepID=A0A0B1SZI0_OESDE|nr:hypothetical protein OESDEN_09495 [Oesophagostomum dentatum]